MDAAMAAAPAGPKGEAPRADKVPPAISSRPAIIAAGLLLLTVFPASIGLMFVWLLFERTVPPFLAPTSPAALASAAAGSPGTALAIAIDLALLLGFALPHSLLLRGEGQKLLARLLPRPLYYTAYGLVSSVTLAAVALLWRPLPGVAWSASGPLEGALLAAYALAWAGMGWSLWHYGPMKQPGIEQWWAFVRGRRVPSTGLPRTGPYRFTRHPIYLSMAGMIWLTPWMTTSRLLVACVWTGYLLVGAALKEARLRRSLREAWLEYTAAVPALPGFALSLPSIRNLPGGRP